MRLRLAMAGVLLCACALAQQALTLDQLLSFVRSAIKLKQPDREVASYLTKLRLTEKLDERTVEDLQGEGAGPKTSSNNSKSLRFRNSGRAPLGGGPLPATAGRRIQVPREAEAERDP